MKSFKRQEHFSNPSLRSIKKNYKSPAEEGEGEGGGERGEGVTVISDSRKQSLYTLFYIQAFYALFYKKNLGTKHQADICQTIRTT